jgi:hypothetical protein
MTGDNGMTPDEMLREFDKVAKVAKAKWRKIMKKADLPEVRHWGDVIQGTIRGITASRKMLKAIVEKANQSRSENVKQSDRV